jgi:hypothetical protein
MVHADQARDIGDTVTENGDKTRLDDQGKMQSAVHEMDALGSKDMEVVHLKIFDRIMAEEVVEIQHVVPIVSGDDSQVPVVLVRNTQDETPSQGDIPSTVSQANSTNVTKKSTKNAPIESSVTVSQLPTLPNSPPNSEVAEPFSTANPSNG